MSSKALYQKIEAHGRELQALGIGIGIEPVKLCKSLFRIETKIHRLAEDYCNGDIDGDQWEIAADKAKKQISKYMADPRPIRINADPRGYALKLCTEFMEQHTENRLAKDWGGYGILAPDFRNEN